MATKNSPKTAKTATPSTKKDGKMPTPKIPTPSQNVLAKIEADIAKAQARKAAKAAANGVTVKVLPPEKDPVMKKLAALKAVAEKDAEREAKKAERTAKVAELTKVREAKKAERTAKRDAAVKARVEKKAAKDAERAAKKLERETKSSPYAKAAMKIAKLGDGLPCEALSVLECLTSVQLTALAKVAVRFDAYRKVRDEKAAKDAAAKAKADAAIAIDAEGNATIETPAA